MTGVRFGAPQDAYGPLAGYQITGRWTTTTRDPQWRGEVGTEEYVHRHFWMPYERWMSHVWAIYKALQEWSDWREPDHVEVDAVYASSLSGPAGSTDDPFHGCEGA